MASLYQNGLIAETDALYRSEVDGFSTLIAGEDEPVENDFNGDGAFDVADVLTLLRLLVDGQSTPGADVNGDGKFNLLDVVRIIKLLIA